MSWRRALRPGVAMAATGTIGAACVTAWTVPTTVMAKASTRGDYDKVAADISKRLEDNDDMGPTLVRLGWHASGTYSCSDKSGGSDGARMRFSPEKDWGANAGLDKARDFLEPVKAAYPWLSYADLWTYAAVVAIAHMGGPTIPWRAGRLDEPSGANSPSVCGLPDADSGSDKKNINHVRAVFNRMGFNDREIVALLGAHALGRCHPENSGYHGAWTRAPTTFSNEFYRELLESNWSIEKGSNPPQYTEKTGDLMMLPADMTLVRDKDFKMWTKFFADDEAFFFREFAAAFQKLEELGCRNLKDI